MPTQSRLNVAIMTYRVNDSRGVTGAGQRQGKWSNYFLSDEKRQEYLPKEQTIVKSAAGAAGNRILSSFDVAPRLKEINVATLILAGQWDWLWAISKEEVSGPTAKV